MRKRQWRFGFQILLPVLAAAAILAGCRSTDESSGVYVNAKVYTADRENPAATAFVIRDGKFVYVGDEAGALEYGKGVDLRGKRVIPGLVDSHCHPVFVAALASLGVIEIPYELNLKDTLAFLKKEAAGAEFKDRPFVVGFGFGLDCRPNLATDLDQAIPDRPAMIFGFDAHSIWLNTKAMQMVNLTRETPDPVPGSSYFVRDAQGNPSGYVVEVTAELDLLRKLGVFSMDNVVDGLPEVQSIFAKNGVTAVFDAGFLMVPEKDGLRGLRKLENQDRLTMRYFTSYFYLGHHLDSPEHMLTEMKANNREFHSDLLRADTLKIIADGTVEVQSAWMHEDFLPPAKGRGAPLFRLADMLPAGKLATAEGFNIHTHAIGDATVTDTLDLGRELGPVKGTKTICHGQVFPADGIRRFAEQKDIFFQTTPCWTGVDEYTQNVLGRERYWRQFPIGSMVRNGVTVTFGSDFPASGGEIGVSAFFNMWYAVNRATEDSIMPPKTEAISVKDCIDAYTINGAKQLGAADRIGSITVGKSADFVICSDDPFTINPLKLKDITVDATYFRGKNVYRK